MNIFQRKLILASKSPRRKQLLEEAGFQFEVRTQEVEETYSDDMPIEEVPAFLAQKKARSMLAYISAEDTILAADSVVILEGKIYGKPKSRTEAVETLQKLSGSVHRVITGVCLLSKAKEHTFSGISEVHISNLTLEEIEYYVDNFEPYDKAGSYGIQEWIGICKVHRIEGTYTNIMGLPMDLVYKELHAFWS